ncbi:MAG: family 1 glycosylhydrolase [Myxococcota bacterium]
MSRVQPRGLYEMAHLLDRRYGLPIYVTENNGRQMWHGDQDEEADLVVRNLQWLERAVEEGADVRGYFYWSFMDNYEWNHGMAIPLGLFGVDPGDPTKARTPREMAHIYGRIAEEGGVPEDLRAVHPIDPSAPPTGGVPLD